MPAKQLVKRQNQVQKPIYEVSLDCHDVDGVRLGINVGVALPRASVCGYLKLTEWVRADTRLNRIVTILQMP